MTREQKRAAKQAEGLRIRSIAQGFDQPPSYRKMKALLFERGINTGYITIMADYKTTAGGVKLHCL